MKGRIASNPEYLTIPDAARLAGAATSTVRGWIRRGVLTSRRVDDTLVVPVPDNTRFLIAKGREPSGRPEGPYTPPEISRYSTWHEVLDEIAWLVKATYSTVPDLKRKRFRADVLLSNYLDSNKVTLAQLRSAFQPPDGVPQGIWEDVQRGWFNELAFSDPARTSTLGMSFHDIHLNEAASAQRFTFPSWRITTAYYAVYFYLRAITRLKQPQFRLAEHGATLATFKNCALNPFSRTVWRFPFDIAFLPGTRLDRRSLAIHTRPHLRFRYADHPREPKRSAAATFEHVLADFRKRSRRRSTPIHYTLFDFLHDFRVWANYLEIEHLLNLRGSGYKAFLDQNLATILWFVGACVELVFIAIAGQRAFLNRAQRFYALISASSPGLENTYPILPLAQRLQVFVGKGHLSRGLRYIVRPDSNHVRLTTEGGV